jgi:hypothetical protein
MPIGRIITDYTGRARDLNISLAGAVPTEAPEPMSLAFGKVSSFVAGVAKLVQRYTVLLLTPQGSQPGYPDFGTGLPARLMSANLTTVGDLTHAFNFANAWVVSTIRTEQARAVERPLDEQLDTAVLEGITVRGSSLELRINIFTLAGETYDFLLPIPVQTGS